MNFISFFSQRLVNRKILATTFSGLMCITVTNGTVLAQERRSLPQVPENIQLQGLQDFPGCHVVVVQGQSSEDSYYQILLRDQSTVSEVGIDGSSDRIVNSGNTLQGEVGLNETHTYIGSDFTFRNVYINGEVIIRELYNPHDDPACEARIVEPPPSGENEMRIISFEENSSYTIGMWEIDSLTAESVTPGDLRACIPAGDAIVCHWHVTGVVTNEVEVNGRESELEFGVGRLDNMDEDIYTAEGVGPNYFHFDGEFSMGINYGDE